MRKRLVYLIPLSLVLTFVAVAACSFSCSPGTVPTAGGWFCCDAAGNCIYIASQKTQDCKHLVKWCKTTKAATDGTTTCSQWGEG